MSVRIVTDSACDVPPAVAEALGIVVVPAYINIGRDSFLDGIELSRQEFFEKLPHYPETPTTAAPAAGAFAQIYEELAADGATSIISMHIAQKLSAMLNTARLGAEAADSVPVTLFDTGQITMGAGLLVMAAAEAAAAGASATEILEQLRRQSPQAFLFAGLDTLEFLRRSGRVNWAQFGLGTLLRIKPIARVYQGEVTVTERVRTRRRSLRRLVAIMEEKAPWQRIALLYTNSPADAEPLLAATRRLAPEAGDPPLMQITPAIGAHVGPGAVGFACISGQ